MTVATVNAWNGSASAPAWWPAHSALTEAAAEQHAQLQEDRPLALAPHGQL